MQVELGSGRLIPGFEEQLIGAKAGDSRDVQVTFPEEYPAENLKGKAATFDVTVKAVRLRETKIDDDFAKSLGLQDLEQLRGILRDQQEPGTQQPDPHAHEAPASRPTGVASFLPGSGVDGRRRI